MGIINERIEALGKACAQAGCRVQKDAEMAEYTTFKIGGPVDLMVTASDEAGFCAAIKAAREQGVPWFVLGNGSNLLVDDAGIRGMALQLDGVFRKIELLGEETIRCGAGVALSALCAFARNQSLSGLEFAWGIPGTAGGAVYMNAGAYDGEMKHVLLSCGHFTENGTFASLAGEELQLSYRHSVYTEMLSAVISSLTVRLHAGDRREIAGRMEELMRRRREKQPLEFPSAGSVFKRPEGMFAGVLIEQCGLKGAQIGGAQVSEKHAGFIINRGGATCADVERLIWLIQERVLREHGISLTCEVKKMGPILQQNTEV